MPQSLLGLKQIKSGEIGDYITGALGISSTGSTIYASKPYVFNDDLVVSGDVDLKNDFAKILGDPVREIKQDHVTNS